MPRTNRRRLYVYLFARKKRYLATVKPAAPRDQHTVDAKASFLAGPRVREPLRDRRTQSAYTTRKFPTRTFHGHSRCPRNWWFVVWHVVRARHACGHRQGTRLVPVAFWLAPTL